jgi:hypothetical protein
MVDYVSTNYSISPRLLLALLEYQSGALTQPEPPPDRYLLGFRRTFMKVPTCSSSSPPTPSTMDITAGVPAT